MKDYRSSYTGSPSCNLLPTNKAMFETNLLDFCERFSKEKALKSRRFYKVFVITFYKFYVKFPD